MNPISFTPELLTLVVGTFISVLFNYFPALNVWYAALKTGVKSLIMIVMLAIATIVIYVLALKGVIVVTEPINVFLAIKIFFLAVYANQTTYIISPQTKAVKEAKLSR